MTELIKDSPFYDRPRIMENDYAFAIYDGFAVSRGHALVIPKKQTASFFNLEADAYHQCFDLVKKLTIFLTKEYGATSFNIGINNGIEAGQTIAHAHIHIIPRYKDDVKDPRGGVRNILPDPSGYLNKTIDVVAGVIKKDGKFLIARRSKEKHLGGYWEYAGGKIEEGESDQLTLQRELNEEFSIEVEVKQYLITSFFRYEKINVNLKAYLVEHLSGDFVLRDHDAISWVTSEEFQNFEFAPADLPINQFIIDHGI